MPPGIHVQLGKALRKKVPVSVAGVLDYQGTEDIMRRLLPAAQAARAVFEAVADLPPREASAAVAKAQPAPAAPANVG